MEQLAANLRGNTKDGTKSQQYSNLMSLSLRGGLPEDYAGESSPADSQRTETGKPGYQSVWRRGMGHSGRGRRGSISPRVALNLALHGKGSGMSLRDVMRKRAHAAGTTHACVCVCVYIYIYTHTYMYIYL